MLNPELHQQAVDNDLNRVVLPLVQIDGNVVIQAHQFAIDSRPRVAMFDERFHLLLELALTPADDRRHYHDPVLGTQGHDPLDNLVGRLAADRPPTLGTMRYPD